jgi:N-acetylmuramoyl-L-alanine amidase
LSDLVGGADADGDAAVDAALRALSRDGNDRASRLAASLILRRLEKIGALHSADVEAAGFVVLKSPLAPSVLVETAFISNPSEARKLRDPDFQQMLAEQIALAVDDYRRRNQVAGADE